MTQAADANPLPSTPAISKRVEKRLANGAVLVYHVPPPMTRKCDFAHNRDRRGPVRDNGFDYVPDTLTCGACGKPTRY